MIKELIYITLGFLLALWKGDEIVNFLIKIWQIIF
jgi:hypothetical protein